MMTKDKATANAALNLALEIALEKEYQLRKTGQSHMIEPVITAIKEALALTSTQCEVQPEQKTEGKQFQTKFNLEDRVWYMKNNKPTEVIISAVEIFFVNTNQDRITYNAKHVDHSVSWLDHTKLQEEWLFKSKIELLESL